MWRVALLASIGVGCLGVVSAGAQAAPIILPSAHPLATSKGVLIELVPPPKAKVCVARIGPGDHPGRKYPVKLGGPSRRLSWRISVSGHGRWTVSASCGAEESTPDSLGTASRTFGLGDGPGRPHLKVRSDSFQAMRGSLPAHPPRPPATARISISSEVGTGAARSCSSPYMSNAYAVGTGYATRVGFTPTKYKVSDVTQMWRDLEACVPFPAMPSDARDSLLKQMGCYNYYGPAPGPGVTWNLDAWRADPSSWHDAFAATHGCDHWTTLPHDLTNAEFNGYIVQGSLDASSQKAAYLIELGPDHIWMKSHILTSKAFYCLKAGHPGPLVLPSLFLSEMVPQKGPDVGDWACNAAPAGNQYGPPPGGLAGTLYLAQGPAAPAGYWYAVSVLGYPPSSAVAVICFDSISPGGFATFVLHTDSSGDASTTSGCFSGDGPDHWVTAASNSSNHVSWGGGGGSQPPPPPPQTWSEQETPNHPVNTFTNYHNASGMGPAIAAGQWVEVSCKVYDPTIASVNPDGYWYRIASSPWNNAYYSPANTFMNGDPYGGPYTHNTDFAVPNC